jgi:hypothetical protein
MRTSRANEPFAAYSVKERLLEAVTDWMEAGLIKSGAIFGQERYFVRQFLEQHAVLYVPSLGRSHYI